MDGAGEAFNIAQDEVITMSDYIKAIFASVGQTGSIEFKKDAPMVRQQAGVQ